MTTASELVASGRPLIIAHRGNSSAAPENTLPAFLSGVAVGAEFIELDYVHSRDGVPVVFHDVTLDRVTNVREVWPASTRTPVAAKTCAELQQLDAGKWFSPQFAGTRLSTLFEVLATVTPHACVAVERKTGDVPTLLRVLSEGNWRERVVVMAFDWFFLTELHLAAPDIPLAALGIRPPNDVAIAEIRAIGATIAGWDNGALTVDDIPRFHSHGLSAWCWTVDNSNRAEQLLSAGLDGLTSNRPAEMLALRDSLR